MVVASVYTDQTSVWDLRRIAASNFCHAVWLNMAWNLYRRSPPLSCLLISSLLFDVGKDSLTYKWMPTVSWFTELLRMREWLWLPLLYWVVRSFNINTMAHWQLVILTLAISNSRQISENVHLHAALQGRRWECLDHRRWTDENMHLAAPAIFYYTRRCRQLDRGVPSEKASTRSLVPDQVVDSMTFRGESIARAEMASVRAVDYMRDDEPFSIIYRVIPRVTLMGLVCPCCVKGRNERNGHEAPRAQQMHAQPAPRPSSWSWRFSH